MATVGRIKVGYRPVWRLIQTIISLGLTFAAPPFCAARTLPKSIDRVEHVLAGKEELYVRIRSADQNLPILLWVHGGPGGAERPLFRYYNGGLEKSFTVVYWDQRGAGRSFDSKEDSRDLTIAQHLADLDAVVDHLRVTLRPDKIVLVGHSWGAALSILYAADHPDKVSAVFAVNPLISVPAQRRAEYQFVLEEARQRDDENALRAAEELGAPPYDEAKSVLRLEKLSNKYGGVFHNRPGRLWTMLSAFVRGLVWPWEIPKYIRANNISLQAMGEELNGLDLTKSTPNLAVPVVFCLGRFDRHADAHVAETYFESIRAPVKRLVWFENSAHNVPFEEPELFNASVVREFELIEKAGKPLALRQSLPRTPVVVKGAKSAYLDKLT